MLVFGHQLFSSGRIYAKTREHGATTPAIVAQVGRIGRHPERQFACCLSINDCPGLDESPGGRGEGLKGYTTTVVSEYYT